MAIANLFKPAIHIATEKYTPPGTPSGGEERSGSSGNSSRIGSIFTAILPAILRSFGSNGSNKEANDHIRMVLRDIENIEHELGSPEWEEVVAMCAEAYQPYRPSSPVVFAPIPGVEDEPEDTPSGTNQSYSSSQINNPFIVAPFKKLRRITKSPITETVAAEQLDLTWKMLNTGELYCLKVFHKNSATKPNRRKIILRELQAYKRLAECEGVYGVPLLMQLLGAFEDKEDGSFFFAFPLLQCDFSVVIHSHVMSVSRNKSRWLAQIATGIQALLQCGIIHRDLKPGNILLDNQGNAVITDFGLSYTNSSPNPLRPHLKYLHGFVGTCPYMAPEVLESRYNHTYYFGAEIDWWALGCIAWEMETACGKTLFCRKQDVRIFCRGQNTERGGYYALREKGLSRRAALMIGGLLHWDPLQRSGYEELREDLYFFNDNGKSEFLCVTERATSRMFKQVPGSLRNRTVATKNPRLYVPVVRPPYDIANEESLDNYCWINPTGYWGEDGRKVQLGSGVTL
ncbi:kinase-like domain-containing protein [Cyathus striatus]|nr:kinase-like domain-containing protein [Cyathus striatus]